MEIISFEVIWLMALHKKMKLLIVKVWTTFVQGGGIFLGKVKRVLSFLILPLKYLNNTYQRWPRIFRICSLYLLVVILSGAIFVWRSSQLRTINPYIGKLKFTELENDYLSENNDKNMEQGKPGEPAATEPDPAEPVPEDEAAEPPLVWPVKGREIYHAYNIYFNEELTCLAQGSSYSFYQGLAIKADAGEKVYSISGGKVLRVNDIGKPYYGKEVIIKHDGNLKVYYGALDQVYVKEKQQVARGDIIATVKQNPEGEDTYIYLEIKENGLLVNPLDVLP